VTLWEKPEKNIEKQLLCAKQERERTVVCLEEPIALLDGNHHLIRVSEAMARIFGKNPVEIISKQCFLSTDGVNMTPYYDADFNTLCLRIHCPEHNKPVKTSFLAHILP